MDQSSSRILKINNENKTDLHSQDLVPAFYLPEPNTLREFADLPRHPPNIVPTSKVKGKRLVMPKLSLTLGVQKGFIGAIVRTVRNVPPCVWVINQHSEEITVVVSKYKPDRLLTGVELNASATGAGLNVTTTVNYRQWPHLTLSRC
jgi:hypothetical protein